MEKLNINKEIKKIEKALKQTIKSDNAVLEEASHHLLSVSYTHLTLPTTPYV